MRVGKTYEEIVPVRALLERAKKSRESVLDKIPQFPVHNLNSEAFLIKKNVKRQRSLGK